MLTVNLILPFVSPFSGFLVEPGTAGNFYRSTIAQFDFGFDSHNIALTYEGDYFNDTNGRLYVYYGFGEEDGMGIDVGLRIELENEDNKGNTLPPTVGLGFSSAFTDSVSLKARLMATFDSREVSGGNKENDTYITLDLLPTIGINDNITAYIGLGFDMGMFGKDYLGNDIDNTFEWRLNPYIVVGGHFFAGIKLWSEGKHVPDLTKPTEDKATIKWSIPIGLNVSF